MRSPKEWLAVGVCGAMLVGCHKEEKAPQTASPAPSVAAKPAVAGAPVVAVPLPEASSSTVKTMTPSALTPPPPLSPITTASVTVGTHPDPQKLLDDASKQLSAKKWDEAAADFRKLDEMRGDMSAAMKESLNAAEADFASAKKAARPDVPTTRAADDITPPNK